MNPKIIDYSLVFNHSIFAMEGIYWAESYYKTVRRYGCSSKAG